MWVVIPLVVGSVLLVVAGFAWVARRETLERARSIEALDLTPIDRATSGRLSAVRARVRVEELIADPVSGEKVGFYEARVARVDGGERTLRSMREGTRLGLEDESGRAELSLKNAELALAWKEVEHADGEPSPSMRKLLEAGEVEAPAPDRGARYVLFHRAIREGDTLTVVGVAGASGEKRGDRPRARFDANNGVLIVTDAPLEELKKSESADVRAMSHMLRIASAIGTVLVALSAVLLLLA